MKHIAALCLLIAMIIPLSGFGAMNTGSDVASQAETETLRVFWMRGPSDTQELIDLINQFAEDFEAENAGVNVEITFVDWSVGTETIHQAVEDGNPPDISVVGARWVPEFVAAGYIEPLDRYLTREFRNRFIPAIINEGAIYQGRTFGLPVAASTRALYYNLDLFEEAGIESPPETWDELLETSLAIHALDDDTYGFGMQAGDGIETNTYFYYFVWGNGGDLYNATNSASTLNDPEAVEALEFAKLLVDSEATQPDVLTYDRRNKLELDFASGRIGMIITGSWVASRLRRDLPNFNFGVAQIPYNTTPATYGVIDTLVMFRTSRDKNLAWEYLEFLYDEDRRFEYVTTAGVLPGLEAVAERPEIAEDQDFSVFLSLLPNARFEPLHPESEAIAQAIIDAVVAVQSGDTEPQDALDAAVEEIDDLLETTSAGW